MQGEVRKERSNWRDEKLSAWHRDKLGYNCPAADIDFLMVEYDKGKPAALVEYKREDAIVQDINHPSYRAVAILANGVSVPFFIVRYSIGLTWFGVIPVNEVAKIFVPNFTIMTESEYIFLMYKIRGRLPD
jgi:hypothetical protein